MPRGLIYAPRAIADIAVIRAWLMQPGAGLAAKRRLAAIRLATDQPRSYPCSHPAGEHPGARELPCDGGYRVLYRVNPDTGRNTTAGDVRVLRIFGPGQDRSTLL